MCSIDGKLTNVRYRDNFYFLLYMFKLIHVIITILRNPFRMRSVDTWFTRVGGGYWIFCSGPVWVQNMEHEERGLKRENN